MEMKLMLFTFCVVVAFSEVYGRFDDSENGPGRGGRGRPGGRMPPPPFRQRGPPPMFPKCKEFMNAVHEKMRETGCGPFACRNAADKDDCMYQELLKARMAVTVKPTEECLDQMQEFMEGVPITTTTEAEVTTTTKEEKPQPEGF
ncbi:u14-Nephitoxin-Nsp1a_1 [Trichonephila clavata]|uniref:U14-Nephitoxin-Nsp1a_1 n=1 Tax=Trichonephila clavata TaxID=2740835 RepID=A0A8X6H1N1_TRICU|nr:u14-Nephitoxin-Nsp1a_1 [Trichonephila clavata]